MSGKFVELFQQTTMNMIVDNRPIVTIPENSGLSTALHVLNDNMINSVPLVNKDNRVVGIVDHQDIMEFILEKLKDSEEFAARANFSVDDALEGIGVGEVVDFSRGDPLVTAEDTTTIGTLMKFFVSGLCHRCVINTKSNDVGYSICSQIDVVTYVVRAGVKDNSELREILDTAYLGDMLQNRSTAYDMVLAEERDSVHSCLTLMHDKQVSALGIVDPDGDLIGNFSLADISCLSMAVLKDLNLPVKEFLAKYSPASLCPVTIEKSGTTILEALNIIASLGVHRLWIVDSFTTGQSIPLGVVTITDLLLILTKL